MVLCVKLYCMKWHEQIFNNPDKPVYFASSGGQSMHLGDRIKLLRKESGWSQDDLAKQINTDARQISRYENDKITPSAEVLVKLAEAFHVSVDYLLLENAARSTLRLDDKDSVELLQTIKSLTEEDRASLSHIINALVVKNKMKSLTQHL